MNTENTDSKELLLKQPGALAEMPFSVDELAADADLGGKIGLADISIPYLYVLQSNSPQCNADSDKYIEGSKSGMLYLTNLEKIYEGREKGLTIVPCYYERLVTEWIDRDAGGGLVASHAPDAKIIDQGVMNDKNQFVLPNGHTLIDTAYHYILVHDPLSSVWYQCIMPLKSTALKASRKMNSDIKTTMIPGTNKPAPRFLYKWNMMSTREQKDQYVYSAVKFTPGEIVSADIYAAAKAYAIVSARGLLRRAAAESAQESETISNERKADPKTISGEIPF